jgi:hypothetical protein
LQVSYSNEVLLIIHFGAQDNRRETV